MTNLEISFLLVTGVLVVALLMKILKTLEEIRNELKRQK
jgi:hypothetical protein